MLEHLENIKATLEGIITFYRQIIGKTRERVDKLLYEKDN